MPTRDEATKQPLIFGLVSALVIAAFAWFGYANSLDVPFTFDDEYSIVQNPGVHIDSLSPANLAAAAFNEHNQTPRPVAYLSFGINHALGQLDVTGYHVVNITIHMINGWLVYLLALHLCPILITRTKDAPFSTRALFALAVAMLFISHPIQTQSVTYIVQRMASLCTLFYLAGLLCYIRGRGIEKPSVRTYAAWWGGALVFWVLALGTKQFAVTLPLASMLYEWIARGGSLKIQKRTAAVAGGGFALMLLVALVFKSGLFFEGGTFAKLFKGYEYRDFTLAQRLMTEPRVVMHHIGQLAWPAPSRLALLYDYPVSTSLIAPATTILSLLGIAVMGVGGLVLGRKLPLLAFGMLWFLLHLAVESTVIPLELVYEHRLYVPIIGAGLLFVGAVFLLIKKPQVAFASVFVLSVVLTFTTRERNETWRDSLGFWQDNAEKHPGEPRVLFNMAVIHKDAGRYTEAIDLLQKTIEADPMFQEAWVRAGALLKLTGRYQESANAYTAAIAYDFDAHPRLVKYHWDAYTQRGSLLHFAERYEQAVGDYTSALELPPLRREQPEARQRRDIVALAGRALAYMSLRRDAEAAADLERVLEIDPDHREANNNLAWILATSSDSEIRNGPRAVSLSAKACELAGWQDLSTLSTHAVSHAEAGNFVAAIEWQTKCIQLAPPQLVPMYQERLELFQNDMPYRPY